MTRLMLPLALLLLLLGLIVLRSASRRRQAAGIPGGRIVYSDTNKWQPLEAPLYDPVAKLTGRPDYLVREGKTIIPVEVKSGRAPDAPYDSHIFQVAAYCLLVERHYGVRPPHGLIHYDGRTFAVDYTPELQDALMDVLTEMRQAELLENVDRSHDSEARCRGCGFSYTCDQVI